VKGRLPLELETQDKTIAATWVREPKIRLRRIDTLKGVEQLSISSNVSYNKRQASI